MAAGHSTVSEPVTTEGPTSSGFSGSILFHSRQAARRPLSQAQPACFPDLRLDQVIADTLQGRDEYDLHPLFYTLPGLADVHYRQAVMRDLGRASVRAALGGFVAQMDLVRQRLRQADELRDFYQRQFLLIAAADAYRRAVTQVLHDLAGSLDSDGLQGIRAWLGDYVTAERFTRLARDVDRVETLLAGVRYCFHLEGTKVTVSRYQDEVDYGAEVEETFAKFAQGEVDSHLVTFHRYLELNHVEARILALVAGLFPEEFDALNAFSQDHDDFLDETVARFDREGRFLLAWLDHLEAVAGHLPTCLPVVSEQKTESGRDVFDVALAAAEQSRTGHIVTNSYELREGERVLVVSGANQGGKTTFARTFGQIHYLAALGLPVAGQEVRVALVDGVFTHFKREEDLHDLHSGLEDDILRIHEILRQASGRSVIIMNEIFSSTSLEDARELGRRVLRQIIDRKILCVDVSFIDELSRLDEHVVSMVAGVDPDDPSRRTFQLERRPADGLAHAVAVARKYGLSKTALRERIAR